MQIMERMFPTDDDVPFIVSLYYASSIHDMQVSRDQTAEEIIDNLLGFAKDHPRSDFSSFLVHRHNLYAQLSSILCPDIPIITRDENYHSILYILALGIFIPSVLHHPEDDKSLPKNRLVISDRVTQAKQVVKLPKSFYSFSLEAQGFIKQSTDGLKNRSWHSDILLNGTYRSKSDDHYTLIGVSNRLAFEKEKDVLFNQILYKTLTLE